MNVPPSSVEIPCAAGTTIRRPSSPLLSTVSTLLALLSVFGLAFVPLRGSQDEWWHLKSGQWIWQHKGLPAHDIFTYTGENLRWHNHEWLSQLLFYGAYSLGDALSAGGGLVALIAFKALLVVGAFMLVARLAYQRLAAVPGGWTLACVVAVVGADIARRTIHPRPPVFSYVLFAGFLLTLYAWKRGHLRGRWLWALVPVTALWANLHGMVLLAIVAVGAFAAGETLENGRAWLWARRGQSTGKHGGKAAFKAVFTPSVARLWALTLFVTLACMAQPSGYHLFFLGRNFTADPLLQKIILEMQPTPGPFVRTDPAVPAWQWGAWMARPPGFWTFWVALAVTAGLFLKRRGRLPYAADYLLLGFFTYQAVMHWRLLPLFSIAAAGPVASLLAGPMRGGAPSATAGRPSSVWQQPLALALLAGLVGWFNFTVAEPPPQTFLRRNLELFRGHAANLADYPAPLMDYLENSGLPPRIFTDSNYCGYAIWRLSPERYKLFTDNRFDLFGSKYVRLERTVFFALHRGDRLDGVDVTEDWDEILRRYGVNVLLFRPIDRPDLFEALKTGDEWRLVFYYIAPQAAPRNWPLEGYYVWLRDGQNAAALAQEAAQEFRKKFPGQPLPGDLWRAIKDGRVGHMGHRG